MILRVNGAPRGVQEGLTVTQLLANLGLRSEEVAVERNGALVSRSDHDRTVLTDGDVLEIVTLVGGG